MNLRKNYLVTEKSPSNTGQSVAVSSIWGQMKKTIDNKSFINLMFWKTITTP